MDPTVISISPTLLAILLILLGLIYFTVKSGKILSGPTGVPYLGLWPFLQNETCHLKLTEYRKTYGDIYSFTFTGKLYIHLGTLKAIKEVHVNKSEYFGGRSQDFNIFTFLLGNGLVMINGDPWKTLRKFFVQNFKEYGLTTMKDDELGPVYDSLSLLIEDLKTRKNTPICIVDLLTEKCMVAMRKFLFGENGISDEQMQLLIAAYGGALEHFTGANMMLTGPFARLLFFMLPKFRQTAMHQGNYVKILNECVKKMESSYDEDHPTCVIESYFKERNERRRKNDPTWKFFTDNALVDSLAQFAGDGILGLASFIGLFLNTLIVHPEEQDKIYKELIEVVGLDRQPTIEDKSKLQYTNAFINEVIRVTSVFPIFPSLECTKETTIRGYKIPKGSITLMNFWSAHHDPETYENPEKFNPYRFISDSEKSREELPILFGIGKRSCSGEGYVMKQAFLLLATIIKNFHIVESSDQGNSCLDLNQTWKLEIIVSPRSDI